jgi:hypothetical protein
MLCPPQPPDPLIANWIDRHRSPVSFVLHMVGIPPTILGVLLIPVYLTLLSLPIFLLALAMFVGGFLLQFLAHGLEASEPGEIAALRAWWQKRTGRRRVEVPAPGRAEA